MAINLITEPDSVCPTPVGSCVQFRVDFDEHCLTLASAAFFTVTLNGNGSDGVTTMTLQSNNFQGNGSGLGSWVETSGTDAENRAYAIEAMLMAHPQFIDATVSIVVTNPNLATVTVTWNDTGAQPVWVFAIGSVVNAVLGDTNGVDGVYLDTRKFWYQILDIDLVPVSERYFITPSIDPLLYQNFEIWLEAHLSKLVFTSFPGYNAGIIVIDPFIRRDFSIRYGMVDLENCQVNYPEIFFSDVFGVVNQAHDQPDDILGSDPYCINNAVPVIPMHTYMPFNQEICEDTYCWLFWFGDASAGAYTSINNNVRAYDADDVLLDASNFFIVVTDPDFRRGYALPCGSANASAYVKANNDIIAYYTIDSFVTGGTLGLTPIFEQFVFTLKACCKLEELYFLDPKGGFSTQVIEKQTEKFTTTANEVCITLPCGPSAAIKEDGIQLINRTAWSSYFAELKRGNKNNAAELKKYEALLSSELIYRRVTNPATGFLLNEKIHIISGSISMHNGEGNLILKFEWRKHETKRILSYG